ncbi:MAG: branched-chain amino acid ABC transporter permease [Roseitalea sp.]|nr:branched-chain amino acid ABC transporter permease [Roseitalea sp.]MBO6953345.1 branched-chain amino acid ABC transporter permease [Rhizobiaceae bacterium]MBO6593692.1 branched-chain amino acid ABC transporter permease [Roseitalea sp.]MBO6601088.1 branched-chain amino acid ABC transporter permease [Roseitalea sp.]MBO6612769.1 branched-chain amino acid ABC transporter permease [Roseitalea sp.]
MTVKSSVLLGSAALALLIALIGFSALLFAEPYHQRIVFIFMVNLIIVLGLQVFMGNCDITHFGHIGFMGIAAYAVAVLATPIAIKKTALATAPFGLSGIELPLFFAVPGAIAITLIVAFFVGLVMVRQTGVPATIATLAFLVVVHVVLLNWVDLTRGPRAFYGIPIKASLSTATAIAVIGVLIARMFRDSRWGVQLRASSEDAAAAAAVGVRMQRLRFAAWMLSALFLSVAGVLFALFVGTISPKSFYFELTFLTLAMLIIGGMHSVTGAVVGAIVVALGLEVTRFVENGPDIAGFELPQMFGLTGFYLGAVIVFGMAFRSEGIVGPQEIEEWWGSRQQGKQSDAGSSEAPNP